MDASPFIMVGISAAAMIVIYAFIEDIRRDRQVRRIKAWVMETHPDAWAALPKFQRQWLRPDLGLKRLEKDAAIDDPGFAHRMASLREKERRILRLILVGLLLVLMVGVGAKVFDWNW